MHDQGTQQSDYGDAVSSVTAVTECYCLGSLSKCETAREGYVALHSPDRINLACKCSRISEGIFGI